MTRPLVIDAMMFNNELDLLELRLTEIADAVDRVILVESERDHQHHRKPLHFADNRGRFAAWADKIVHVVVRDGEMPSVADDPDPWAREHSQREFIRRGLAMIDGVDDRTVLMQSDVDEIPRALPVRQLAAMSANGTLAGTIVFTQRLHCFCVDWLYPTLWQGTTATTLGHLGKLERIAGCPMPFAYMRDQRMTAPTPPGFQDCGWHLSWLGGHDAAMVKVGSFCHPEVEQRIREGLASERFLVDGWHVDGIRQKAVDVDGTWPKWIVAGNAPPSWFRAAYRKAAA